MQLIRAAVIGVGYLGRFHAQKYAQAQACQLVAVVDVRAVAREAALREFSCEALVDYRELLGRVDVVSVVTPTPKHFAIARDFLDSGSHVLVEKPASSSSLRVREAACCRSVISSASTRPFLRQSLTSRRRDSSSAIASRPIG